MKGSSTKVNPATETFGQARQGSVAAIIQVLNERLADSGIRTRAVVADGVLQLLCEAETSEKLEQAPTVERVRSELERISPQRIKRVRINSRIVREEQLLWLEEINKDPENALLWAETITLKRPFFLKRWIRDRHLKPAGPIFKDITEPEPSQSSLSNQIIGGLGLVALLFGALWLFREDLSALRQANSGELAQPNQIANNLKASNEATTEAPASEQSSAQTAPQATGQSAGDRTADTTLPAAPAPTATATKPAPNPTTAAQPATESTSPAATATSPSPPSSASSTGNASDAFAEAVRVANQAAVDGQTASTKAEWLDLAARWQKASDLMGNIPESNEQYAIAQDRITTYQQNSQAALQQATALQNP
ncbi:MAG: hypothetical protein AB8B99_06005 [Phormidesmis sp.]